MPRLIDADALITAVLKNAIDYAVVFGDSEMHRLLVQVIAHQPTIDAVPVIRCKDCIHNVANRKTDSLDTADYSGIDIVCDYFMTDGQEPDDYCSKAEPKETNNDR